MTYHAGESGLVSVFENSSNRRSLLIGRTSNAFPPDRKTSYTVSSTAFFFKDENYFHVDIVVNRTIVLFI